MELFLRWAMWHMGLVFKLIVVDLIFIHKKFCVLLEWIGNMNWWWKYCISYHTATSRCILCKVCLCMYCQSKMTHELWNPFSAMSIKTPLRMMTPWRRIMDVYYQYHSRILVKMCFYPEWRKKILWLFLEYCLWSFLTREEKWFLLMEKLWIMKNKTRLYSELSDIFMNKASSPGALWELGFVMNCFYAPYLRLETL